MPAKLTLQAVGLHWLSDESTADLCAHGGIRVWLDGAIVLESTWDSHALSTGAFHLLRTLQSAHGPRDGTMIPCCGHVMWHDDQGRLCNAADHGGNSGDRWTVAQDPAGGVLVDFDNGGPPQELALDVWRAAVLAFAREIARFYGQSPPRVPSTEEDATWYPAMCREWAQLAGFELEDRA